MTDHQFDFEYHTKMHREGEPVSFGTNENNYQSMLEESGVKDRLVLSDRPKVVILGCMPESVIEFARFINGYNPHSHIIYIDLSDYATQGAKSVIETNSIQNAEVIQSNGLKIGLQDNSVDVIFTHILFRNLGEYTMMFSPKGAAPQIMEVLNEGYRVIKPGGGFFSVNTYPVVPGPDPGNPEDIKYFNEQFGYETYFRGTGFKKVKEDVGHGLSQKEYAQKHNLAFDTNKEIKRERLKVYMTYGIK